MSPMPTFTEIKKKYGSTTPTPTPDNTPDNTTAPPLVRKTAPDVQVSERKAEPQEAMYQGDLDRAQRLIDARLGRQVFDHASGEIVFKDPKLVGRWFNEAINHQRLFQAEQSGWIPTRPEMIADLRLLGVYAVDPSGHIVRGQRGEEHLYFMTQVNVDAIATAKMVENDRRLGAGEAVKEEIAERAATEIGSEAAEFIATKTFGTVQDGIERIERVESD